MIQKKQVNSDTGSSDDDTVEDLMDVAKLKEMKKDKPMRTSVSAEAYGKFNKKVNNILFIKMSLG